MKGLERFLITMKAKNLLKQLPKYRQAKLGVGTYKELRGIGAPALKKEIYLPMLSLNPETTALWDPELEGINWKANKYLAYQYSRMERARLEKNYLKYWAICKGLHNRSRAYRIAILNKVYKNWMTDLNRKQLEKLLKDKWIPWGECHKPEFSRFYLHKPNGKLRPIGAPALLTKLYQTSLNLFLINLIDPQIGEYQHGFRPNRGFHTAVERIAEIVEDGCHKAFELDFTKCFNSISLEFTKKALMKKNVPEELAQHILEMNQVIPKYDKIEDKKDPELWEENLNSFGMFEEEFQTPMKRNREYGFTQGSPLSPTLAITALDEFLKSTGALELEEQGIIELVFYADDGLIFCKYDSDKGRSREINFRSIKHLEILQATLEEEILKNNIDAYTEWSAFVKYRNMVKFMPREKLRVTTELEYLDKYLWKWLVHDEELGFEINEKKSKWTYNSLRFLGAEMDISAKRLGGKWQYKYIEFMGKTLQLIDRMIEGFTFKQILEKPDLLKKFYSYRPSMKLPEIKPLVVKNPTPFAVEILPEGVDYYQPYWVNKIGPMPKEQIIEKVTVAESETYFTKVTKWYENMKGYGMIVMGLRQDLSSYATAAILVLTKDWHKNTNKPVIPHIQMREEEVKIDVEMKSPGIKIRRVKTFDERFGKYNKDGITAKGKRMLEKFYQEQEFLRKQKLLQEKQIEKDIYEFLVETDEKDSELK